VAARSAGILALALGLLVATGAGARSLGPVITAQPNVSGIAEAGSRLAAGSGTWTSATTVSYAYQWYRCDAAGAHCSSIHGATAPGLTLGKKDVAKTIGLTVTATDVTGSTSAYASLVGPVASAKPLLVSTAQPQVTGLAVEGKQLQVTTGAWSPTPTSLTYAWRRCNANGRVCAAIAGANASAYTVAAADVGHALVALVQAGFGTTTQAALSTASPTAIGGDVAGPSHSAPPAIRGVARRGVQLTGSTGLWAGIGSLTYRYQWYRCDGDGAHCSAIHGATKTTYRTVPADSGRTLGFTVRATDSTGTATAYSSLFGPVAPPYPAVTSAAAPTLSGSARPGSTLSVDTGLWRPRAGTLSYAWRRCNANGRICVPIAGAKAPTYEVTAADVGHALAAVVGATVGSATQAAYSTASPPVS
jgi:Ig domain of plant-specific actin-binding protein